MRTKPQFYADTYFPHERCTMHVCGMRPTAPQLSTIRLDLIYAHIGGHDFDVLTEWVYNIYMSTFIANGSVTASVRPLQEIVASPK